MQFLFFGINFFLYLMYFYIKIITDRKIGYDDMKLERFKVQDNKKKFIIVFTVCCVLLLAGVFLYTSFAVFIEEKQFNVINGKYQDPGDLYFAVYVDGQITNTFPSKDSGYTLDTEKSSCTNGATVSWDNDSWSALVNFSNYSAGNMSRTKCTMYFKEQTAYDKCIAEGKDEVTCNMIANVDTSGQCPTVNEDGTVEVTAKEDTESLICTAPDDYGTSYYYRGNVDNNYVKFAGYYWRILRVNGDGSIRMIYAGDADVIDALPNKTEVLANGYNDANTDYTQIGASSYNSSRNDNAYVGYMYGATGASTYEETHANINNSTIKTRVDEWYEENIASHSEYAQYISDTLFCNDRSFASSNTGTGAGTSQTYYRWYSSSIKTLKCSQQNDRFTVDDEVVGNGDLTYPVGLLTTDEAALAGGYNSSNSGYYLYTGNNYWTMSPRYFSGSSAFVRGVGSAGNLDFLNLVSTSTGVRPVLNLKSGSLTKGSGTATDPFLV